MKPRRPSPAMVVAVIALIASLAGTAYAASKITGSDIQKNSVDANRLKNKTLTAKQVKRNALKGPQIKESSLGKVRRARQADVAVDAQALNGLEAKTFVYEADDGSTDATVLSFGSLTLTASCEAGAGNGLTVKARTSAPGALISFTSISQGGVGDDGTGTARNDSYRSMPTGSNLVIYSPNGVTRTTNGGVNVGWSTGQIVYAVPATGEVTSIDWTWNSTWGGHDCSWVGTAVGGDSTHEVIMRDLSGEREGASSLSELERARRAG